MLTPKHSGGTRRWHILGAYIILHCYRHALQWTLRNGTRIVRGDIHKRVHAIIFVLNCDTPGCLSGGSGERARRESTPAETSSHDLSNFGLLCARRRTKTLTPISGPSPGTMTTERRAKKAKYSEQEHARRKVSFQSLPESKREEVNKSSAKKLGDVSTESATFGKEKLEPSLSSSFKIIAGSYERLLYGLQGTVSVVSPASSELQWTLKPIFIFPAHVSCIKSVAASPQGGKWLATGSGDEIIKVWDLRRRKEVGGLMQHEGLPPLVLHVPRTQANHLV
jgi:WD40 repeat protein